LASKFARLSRRPYAGGQTAAKKVPDAPSFGFVIPVEFSPFRLQRRERKPVAGEVPTDICASRTELLRAITWSALWVVQRMVPHLLAIVKFARLIHRICRPWERRRWSGSSTGL